MVPGEGPPAPMPCPFLAVSEQSQRQHGALLTARFALQETNELTTIQIILDLPSSRRMQPNSFTQDTRQLQKKVLFYFAVWTTVAFDF